MKVLFLLNDAPYGSDKNYNALRTAIQLKKQDINIDLCVYLMSDAVVSGASGQVTKSVNYNIGDMLTEIVQSKGQVKVCTSCAESRGITLLIKGVELGTLADLTQWIASSDKILTF